MAPHLNSVYINLTYQVCYAILVFLVSKRTIRIYMLKRKRVNSETGYTVVNLSIEHKERVKYFSQVTGFTMASIIETAIDEFLERFEKENKEEEIEFESEI